MAADFKTAQPIEYYKQFIKENIRPDGRRLGEFRKVFLNIGSINTADGSALVRLGETMVVCGIKAELADPSVEEEEQGYFVPNVELPPLCSSEILPGPPTASAQVLSQQVLECVKNSGVIDLKELCLAPKKLCWVIYADIVCVSHDGNLFDAIMVSLLAALRNTKLPLVTIDEESEEVIASNTDTFELKLHDNPVSTTISLFDARVLLVDPTREEEDLSRGTITVVCGDNEQLVSIYKPGGIPVSDDTIRACVHYAVNRRQEVVNLISNVTDGVDR